MQILEGEINLREETRVAEQAKPALPPDEYTQRAGRLSETQNGLRERVVKIIQRMEELPDGANEFRREIQLLEEVSMIMKEATGILAKPDTGSPAIAAETDVIELLLK